MVVLRSLAVACRSQSGGATVEVRLLGPVEAHAAGRRIEVGQPRQLCVLAALAVDVGRLVTVETIVDRVWGDAPPPGARRSLHSHIARLRRAVDQAATPSRDGSKLVRRAGGYLLDVDPDRVDVLLFRQLVTRARRADVEPAEAARLLRQALALWRAEPLAGVQGQWAERQRESWRGLRLDAAVGWAQAELDQGDAAAVIPTLTDLVGENPLAELLVDVLMRALHAAGRTVGALELYTRTRKHLAEELGTEPDARLRRLYQAILREEIDLPGPRAAGPRVAGGRPAIPAQLPANVSGFIGREAHLRQLDAILAGSPGFAVVVTIAGTAGIGKTALATHWAHRAADRFPDGQLSVNLRGFDIGAAPLSPAAAIRTFLDALDVPPERVPGSLDAQVGLYRSLLARRRMLLLLDNAHDVQQVRPLLPGAAACVVVVTSRSQLTGLVSTDGARPIMLDLLSGDEARQLLAHRIGAARLAAEPAAVEEIVVRCARLPLALSIVAARAAMHPTFALATIAEELRETEGGLDALDGGDPTSRIRTVFSWSYRTLGPDAARLFRLLGLHPGVDLAPAAAASLVGVPVRQARSLLAEIARVHLLMEHVPGRYTFHDLLRAYAAELAHANDPDRERRAATTRLLDHYLHTANTADRLLDPTRDQLALTPPLLGVTPEHLSDQRPALDWFRAEHPVLMAVVEHGLANGLNTQTWQLAWALQTFLYRQGHWHDGAVAGRAAVTAAGRLADPRSRAHAHRLLAIADTRLGRFDEAHTHLWQCLDLYRRADDRAGQAHAHDRLGYLLERQNRTAQAIDHARESLALFRAAGHQIGQARALNAVGWCHALLGEYQAALTACREALTLHEELGDRLGQAAAWDSLGYAHHHLGQHTEALACYRQTLNLYRDLTDRYHEAVALHYLGDTHRAMGDLASARDHWQRALAILDDLDHPDAEKIRTKLR